MQTHGDTYTEHYAPQNTDVFWSPMKTNPRFLLGVLLIDQPFWGPCSEYTPLQGSQWGLVTRILDRTWSRSQEVHLSIKALSIFEPDHHTQSSSEVHKALNTTYFCFTNSSVMSFLTSPKSECLTLAKKKK